MLAAAIDTRQFQTLMSRLARAWNKQNAADVAACFHTNATFMNTTRSRFWQGRDEILQYIEQILAGGSVHTVWHHLLFNEPSQVGSGEYSFAIDSQHRHGVALVKIADGRIAHWRAYETQSDLGWQQFVGDNNF